MCWHDPPCPSDQASDREAAKAITHAPAQEWAALCNGVIHFEDTGELLPDDRVIPPHRSVA
ncbi:DUF5999 family protein [Streptomyces sp. NPDC054834]